MTVNDDDNGEISNSRLADELDGLLGSRDDGKGDAVMHVSSARLDDEVDGFVAALEVSSAHLCELMTVWTALSAVRVAA